MIIKIENGEAVGNPIVEDNFRYLYPNIVFPLIFTNAIVEPLGYAMYDFSQIPECGVYQKVIEAKPAKNEYGIWRQQWQVVDLEGQELIDKQTAEAEKLKQEIIRATQKRLDDFARIRDYDSILSACTYAASTNATFAAEGQRAVRLRDDTWQALYNILGQIETQVRVVNGYADVEGDLPALTWA